ncbi:uncharacterized protein LOC128224733 [Mya arenaria]|uniref:uncharacterized protein LOC128224733 n=1 Tax=Mya arenaria TaxID=6604 RepID=UPI0022E4047E|nr:uncharacterized protein LOC128224733 [Mya arenaria]
MKVVIAWTLAQIVVVVVRAAGDAKCAALHGTCHETSTACAGHYQSLLCAGHASRQCCVPSSTHDTIECTGTHRHHATGTAYYPDPSPLEGGYVDMRDYPLQTLQAYLEGTAPFVTVAMDNHAGIAFDSRLCIPELNRKYGRFIDFRVRDTGSAFTNKGYSRIDICVRTIHDSYDSTINGGLTLVFH